MGKDGDKAWELAMQQMDELKRENVKLREALNSLNAPLVAAVKMLKKHGLVDELGNPNI